MDVLAFIAALLLAIGALSAIGNILRPVTNWLAPPPLDMPGPRHDEPADNEILRHMDDGTVMTWGQARQLGRAMKRISAKPTPPPAQRALPDGLRAVRELLEAQGRTAKP